MRIFILQTLNGLSFGMLLFLVSAGLSVIYGLMRVVNLAHGSFYMVGGYVAFSVTGANGDFWLGTISGGLVAAALGAATERLLMWQRSYRRAHNEAQEILLSFGVVLVLRETVRMVWGTLPEMIAEPSWLSGPIRIGNVVFPEYRAWLICFGLVVAGAMYWFQRYTRLGALLRAAVEDGETANAIGINVRALFLGAFCIGGFLAGLAGVLGGAFSGIYPDADLEILVLAFVVVVVGGLGNLVGSFWAGLAVGLIDSFGRMVFPQLALFIVFIPMLVILIRRSARLVEN